MRKRGFGSLETWNTQKYPQKHESKVITITRAFPTLEFSSMPRKFPWIHNYYVFFIAQQITFVCCTTLCVYSLHNILCLFIAQKIVWFYCTKFSFCLLHCNLFLTIAQKFVLFHGTAPPYSTFCIRRL